MATYEKRRILQKAYPAAEWVSKYSNHILLNREIGYETDTGKYKMGDGATPWASLSYYNSDLSNIVCNFNVSTKTITPINTTDKIQDISVGTRITIIPDADWAPDSTSSTFSITGITTGIHTLYYSPQQMRLNDTIQKLYSGVPYTITCSNVDSSSSNTMWFLIEGIKITTDKLDDSLIIPITKGGTGASTAEDARKKLGVMSSEYVNSNFTKTDLSNVDNTIFKAKANEAGVVSQNATPIVQFTAHPNEDAPGLVYYGTSNEIEQIYNGLEILACFDGHDSVCGMLYLNSTETCHGSGYVKSDNPTSMVMPLLNITANRVMRLRYCSDVTDNVFGQAGGCWICMDPVYDYSNNLTLVERLKYYGDPDIIPSDESYFIVNSTGETITGLSDIGKTQTELVIPYQINGIEITTLYSGDDGTSILNGATNKITKVVLPNTIQNIKHYAFSGCSSLISINIPNSVTSIGEGAFSGCSSLINVTIPNSVTSINGGAFCGCSSLTSVTIPNSVTTINSGAFSGCSSLTSITIPNSVTSIDSSAFANIGNLTIYCPQHSYADTFAQKNRIPVKYTEVIDDIGGFWGLGLPLIKTITLEESVTSIDILSKAEGIKLKEFTVLVFIKYLGDAIEDKSISNCIMCLRTNGGSYYFGYKGGYDFRKNVNSFAFWHTKIYDNKFALTDLYNGFGNKSYDIPYIGFQGLADATTAKYSSYTSYSGDAVDNLNVFISSNDVSRGAIIPQGSMVFLLGR